MKVEINYPKLKKEVNKFLIFRKIMLIIFLISINNLYYNKPLTRRKKMDALCTRRRNNILFCYIK